MIVTVEGQDPVVVEVVKPSRFAWLVFSNAQTNGTPKEKLEAGLDLVKESLKNLGDFKFVEEVMDAVPSAYFDFLNAAIEAYLQDAKKATFEKK